MNVSSFEELAFNAHPLVPCYSIQQYMADINDWTRIRGLQAVFGSVYALIFVVGFIGNAGIVMNIIRRKRATMVPNIFLINLSISDLLLCIVGVPIAPFTFVRKEWHLGRFLCKLIPFCQGVTVLISSFGLICIACDRYRNISKINASPWTKRHALMITAVTWLVALLCNSPLYINTQLAPIHITNESKFCGEFCGEFGWSRNGGSKKIFGTIMLHIQFILPGLFMIVCYSGVWKKIQRDMLISAVAGEYQRLRAAKRKTWVLTVLVLMITAFVISWLPLTIVNIMRDFDISLVLLDRQPYFSQLIVHSVAMSSVMWNPLLYFWMNYDGSSRGCTRYEFEATGATSRAPSVSWTSTYLLPKMSILMTANTHRRLAFSHSPHLAAYNNTKEPPPMNNGSAAVADPSKNRKKMSLGTIVDNNIDGYRNQGGDDGKDDQDQIRLIPPRKARSLEHHRHSNSYYLSTTCNKQQPEKIIKEENEENDAQESTAMIELLTFRGGTPSSSVIMDRSSSTPNAGMDNLSFSNSTNNSPVVVVGPTGRSRLRTSSTAVTDNSHTAGGNEEDDEVGIGNCGSKNIVAFDFEFDYANVIEV